MKKFFVGLLIGFLYISILFGSMYKGLMDECRSRGYNAALVGYMGAVCINSGSLEQDEFHMEFVSF